MAASPPHTDGSIAFASWRQCAPPSSTPPIDISTVPVLPLLCHLEHIGRRAYPGMSWTDAFSPSKLPPSRVGIWTPIYYMVPWANPSPHPKRHYDRFSRFCRAHDRDRPTDRQTDPQTTLLRLCR